MTNLAFGLGFTLVTAVVIILADLILKLAADRDHAVVSALVVAACVLYAVSALLWFGAMRHVTLAQAGVAYSMFSLIALALLGALLFGETLRAREFAGLGCAVAAMALMTRVS